MEINWKKVGLFVLFLFIGLVIFGSNLFFLEISPILVFVFLIPYVIFLFFTVKNFSKTLLVITILIPVLYLIIMALPASPCDSFGYWSHERQECDCLGFKKVTVGIMDAYFTNCVGIVQEYRCYSWNQSRSDLKQIECPASFK